MGQQISRINKFTDQNPSVSNNVLNQAESCVNDSSVIENDEKFANSNQNKDMDKHISHGNELNALENVNDTNASGEASVSNANELITNGNELIDLQQQQQQLQMPNNDQIHISQSEDITIGNRIIYHGPITIHQHVLNQNQSNQQVPNQAGEILNQPLFTAAIAGPLRIVERSEWFARPPKCELVRLELPAIRVIIAYTAGKCPKTHAECAEIVRNYQAEYIEMKGWDDIAYNFSVSDNGSIFVGRGWDYQGAHSRVYNKRSICIAFIGTFHKHEPSERSIIAVQQLIAVGVEQGKIAQNYRLYGHRQLIPTTSPGKRIYEIIQSWAHWSEEVIPP